MEIKTISLDSNVKNKILIEKCKELCKKNLVTVDGAGILSDGAIDHANYLVINKDVNAYIAISSQFILSDNDILFDSRCEERGIYIEQILVEEGNRRKGIAKELFYYLLDSTNDNIYAHVSVKNKASLLFFISKGFVPVGLYKSSFYGIKDYKSILLKLSHVK